MVNIMMGPEGSGKTKLLINAINNSVKHEAGSMVCIENGNALRFDVDHRVRLIAVSISRRQINAHHSFIHAWRKMHCKPIDHFVLRFPPHPLPAKRVRHNTPAPRGDARVCLFYLPV